MMSAGAWAEPMPDYSFIVSIVAEKVKRICDGLLNEENEMEQKITLRERREVLQLTQKQVADLVGIAESAYQRYEYGTNEPKVFMAVKIARALKTSVEELFLIDQE